MTRRREAEQKKHVEEIKTKEDGKEKKKRI
jgi:hypothetical protein